MTGCESVLDIVSGENWRVSSNKPTWIDELRLSRAITQHRSQGKTCNKRREIG